MVKGNSDATLKYRVDQLEKQLAVVDANVEVLLVNHVPHLQQELIRMNGQIESLSTKIMVLTGVNLTAIIIGLLASRLIK